MRFTRIPQNTFHELAMDAGILLKTFDPTGEVQVQDEDIICATTGGITAACVPTFSDLGEDVDNCPVNMKELKHLDSWESTFGFTALGISPEGIRLALGAADVQDTKIIPRRDLEQNDFNDIWWVGDRLDGGFVAIRLINALSTAGFSLQTTKNGKGQVSVTLTGHVSIDDQDTMPMEFYSVAGDGIVSPEINLNKKTIRLGVGETDTLTARVVPDSTTVTWTSGSDSIATVANGLVTAVAAGDTIITAQITVDEVEYTDTCTVIVE